MRKGLLYAWPISGRSARDFTESPSVYVHVEGLSDDTQNGAVHFQSGSAHSLESERRAEGFTLLSVAGSHEKSALVCALNSG